MTGRANRLFLFLLVLGSIGMVGALHAMAAEPAPPPDAPATAVPNVSYFPLIYQAYFDCLDIPTLLSPPDRAELVTIHPTFRWNGGNPVQAQSLHMQFATDPQFHNLYISVNSGGVQGVHEYAPFDNFQEGVTYYWRARFRCTDGRYGPFTVPWSFTTGSGGEILPPPQLVSPADGSITESASVTFTWEAMPGASQYKLSIQREGSGVFYLWVEDTRSTISLLANTTYHWWVAAVNDYAVGESSEKWRFTTPSQ